MTEPIRPRIGISECLLGKEVRYDGGHKKNAFALEKLGPHVEWVPVCPEVEVGMPVPREAVRLVGIADRPRMLGHKTKTDHTEAMEEFSARRADELAQRDLDGYILKKGSPSCGLDRVPVYPPQGGSSRHGIGLFARALRARLPSLPLSEEGWLQDQRLRETFLDRIFTQARLRRIRDASQLIEFHGAHKLLYMAHCPAKQKQLGRLVAGAGKEPFDQLLTEYRQLAMEALGVRASAGKHANVLHHIVGYFRGHMPDSEKGEILERIDQYRAGIHPLAVPVALLVHHLHRHQQSDWLAKQLYFEPYPPQIAPR